MFNSEAMRKKEAQGRIFLQERFGSPDPGMDKICTRCSKRYGVHYGIVVFLQCPDEWVADGHNLSI